jgi:hypothetical protein
MTGIGNIRGSILEIMAKESFSGQVISWQFVKSEIEAE